MKRSLIWSVVLVFAGVCLTITALVLRLPGPLLAAPPTAAAPDPEGVVCFGTVDLEHGVASLAPLQPGRVAEILVHENEPVEQGATLVRLEDAAPRARLVEAEAALKLSRQQLERAKKLPKQYHDQVEQQKAVHEATVTRLTAARDLLAQRKKSGQPAAVAAVEVAATELEIRELEALERADALRLAEFQAQNADSEIERADSEVALAEARRDQAKLAVEDCRLKAPRPGRLLRILVGPGDVLAAGVAQPALLFAADGPQVIRATVEQEFASRVKEGESVVVQDEADSSLSYRGRVDRIAAWYGQRRAILHDPSQMSDVRTLECVIALEPGQPRLRLGQGVRVLIGLERQ